MRAVLAASLIVLSAAMSAQAPAVDVAPTRLSFIADVGGRVPPQTVQITQPLNADARWLASANQPWLRLSATSGTGSTTLQIGVETTGLGPGQHQGRVTVSGLPGTRNAIVTVSLQILNRAGGAKPPVASAAAVTLSAPQGSREAATAMLSLEAGADAPARWRVKPDQPWLSVAPETGTVPARVTVTGVPEGLAPGEHRATLLFTDDGGDPWMRVPVAFVVGGEDALTIATDVLPPATRNLPYSQAIPITGGKPPYAIRIVQGRLPQGLMLSGGGISGITRIPGNYPLVLAVTDASAPPVTATREVLLQVIVLYQDTALVVSPPTVSLVTSASGRTQGTRVAIGSGRQALAWRATTDASWLRLAPERGLSPSVLQLDVNTAALTPGTYTATVTITMEGAPNSPARVPVQVVVRQ